MTDGINFNLLEQPTTYEIKNELLNKEPTEKGFIKILLTDYLNDIEGYVLIRKRANFIKSFKEVPLGEELYLYKPRPEYEEDEDDNYIDVEDKGKLLTVSDAQLLDMDHYINGNEIEYLTIPIIDVEHEDDFASGMKFTENDCKEVI